MTGKAKSWQVAKSLAGKSQKSGKRLGDLPKNLKSDTENLKFDEENVGPVCVTWQLEQRTSE